MTETPEDLPEDLIEGYVADCRRSVRYHMHRVRFFQSLANLVSTVSLLSGSAAFASLLVAAPAWAPLAASAIVVVAQLLELVGRVSDKAMLHRSLADAHLAVEKDAAAVEGRATDDDVRRIRQALIDIEAREPPILRALDVCCHNEVVRAMGLDDQVHEVSGWQRAMRHWLPFSAVHWRPVALRDR